jgi:MFS family permease
MTTLATVNLRNWHRAILVFFSVIGLTGSSLMVRLPLVRDTLNISTGTLGLILVAGSVGAMGGLLFVGKFVARVGTKRSGIVGMSIWFFGWVLVSVGLGIGSPIVFAIGNFFGGIGAGVTDVSINVDGSAIEQRLGRAAMPKMHAAFSIGTLLGAGLGTFAIQVNLNLAVQIGILTTISYLIPVFISRYLPTDNGLHSDEEKAGTAGPVFTKVVVLLGLGIFGMTLAEGASNDWLAIGLVDDYNADPTSAGIGFAILVASMTVVRFFGGSLTDRLGKAFTLRITGALGVLGLVLLIARISIPLAWVGSLLWGIGVALAFPLFLSAAGEQPNPARKVATVSAFGYASFLIGPPLLGFVGQSIGVVNMYWIVLVFIILSIVVAGAAGTTRASAKTVKGE